MAFSLSKRFIVISALLFVALWLFMLMNVLSSDNGGRRASVRIGGTDNLGDSSSSGAHSKGKNEVDSSSSGGESIIDGGDSSSSSGGGGKAVNRKPIELHRNAPDVASPSAPVKPMEIKHLTPPKRYAPPPQLGIEPPSIAEVERNVTIFLRTLHARLSSLASPQINPIDALNAYMDVTKNTLLKWDDMNKDRYWKQRR